MAQVLITTVPFGDKNNYPIKLLESNNIDYLINPLGKKLTEDELIELLGDAEIIIAGTEQISAKVINSSSHLKMISRVGIGLDSVDLLEAKKKNITVSYTPDAPAPAVAELTMGLIYSLIRHIQVSNSQLHKGQWHRFFGKRLCDMHIGLIGVGRIGSQVFSLLKSVGCKNISFYDIKMKTLEFDSNLYHSVDFEQVIKNSDLISLHVPLTSRTKNMITKLEISKMKDDVFLINTSRGGVINENDLYDALSEGRVNGAAIDVFEKEPYDGKLLELDTCILTAHMGSMSVDCRTNMEIQATEEAVRFIKNEKLIGVVPDEEYDVQREGL